MESFAAAVEGTTAKDVMMLVLVTQYLDTSRNWRAGQEQHHYSCRTRRPAWAIFSARCRTRVMIGQTGAEAGKN